MTFLAVNDFFFEPQKGISKSLHLLVGLTQEMQHEPQSRTPPYSGQRSHLVYGLL